jgi:isoleucyl-tRNA synthetase
MIQDEVNVKHLAFSQDLDKVADRKLTIQFPVVGKRLGAKMKEVAAAAKKGEWKIKNDLEIEVAGEILSNDIRKLDIFTSKDIHNPEFKIQLQPKEAGRAEALPTNDALVVLDLTITPELEAEGMARDLVRMIQQARKDAGLNVSDRIALVLDLPAAMQPALTHQKYIEEQTLAVSIARSGAEKSEKVSTQELDGEKITIGITKAA